jgi:TonB family protein
MTGSFVVDTLLIWSGQICVLAAVGGLVSLTIAHPKARLLLWQGLLCIMVLLPVVEPWRTPLPEAGIPALIEDAGPPAIVERTIVLSHKHHWNGTDLLWVLAFGAALRLLWVGAGLLRLGRYKRESRRLAEAPVPFGSSSADWYLHDHLTGPVTYGWMRPSVLLPARFEHMQPSVQEAIACHELVHVNRRDWLFVIAEELIRSAFWFHPAIWFVLSRIQLAREQVVDREVIRLTDDRDRYLDALVEVAAQKIQPDLAPAPLFLKKRHLAKRVTAVLQEVSMSRPRIYATLATVCSAVLLAARLSVWLIPFSVPAQVVPDDSGVTVDPGAKILHRPPIHVPFDAKTRGTVVVEVNLNSKGEVSDARVVSGPEELRKTALASVLNWHYQAGLTSAQATINFGQTASAESSNPPAPALPAPSAAPSDKPIERPSAAKPPAQPATVLPKGFNPTFRSDPAQVVSSFPGVLKQINITGLSPDAEQELRSRLPVHEGSTVGLEDVAAAFKAAEEFDRHILPTVHATPGNISLEFNLAGPTELQATASTASSDGFPPPAPGVQRIRVGGNVQAANLITKITPRYPANAKAARIQGVVQLSALIGADGAVEEVHLLSGDASLVPASLDAVRQWVYRPTLLNGKPVEVVTQIDVNFTLTN